MPAGCSLPQTAGFWTSVSAAVSRMCAISTRPFWNNTAAPQRNTAKAENSQPPNSGSWSKTASISFLPRRRFGCWNPCTGRFTENQPCIHRKTKKGLPHCASEAVPFSGYNERFFTETLFFPTGPQPEAMIQSSPAESTGWLACHWAKLSTLGQAFSFFLI